jgi:hypothetical protein
MLITEMELRRIIREELSGGFNVDVYYRFSDGTASKSSWNFTEKTLSKAKTSSTNWMNKGQNTYSKYFFHITGPSVDSWFEVKHERSDVGKLVRSLVEADAPVTSSDDATRLTNEIAKAKKELEELEKIAKKLGGEKTYYYEEQKKANEEQDRAWRALENWLHPPHPPGYVPPIINYHFGKDGVFTSMGPRPW